MSRVDRFGMHHPQSRALALESNFLAVFHAQSTQTATSVLRGINPLLGLTTVE